MKKDEDILLDFLEKNSDLSVVYPSIKEQVYNVKPRKIKVSKKKKLFWGFTSCALVTIIVATIALTNQEHYHNKGITFKTTPSFTSLNKVQYPAINFDVDFRSVKEETVNAIREFAFETSKKLFIEKENYLYSPLSLYFVLSMLNEGTSTDESRQEINNLLRIDTRQNRQDVQSIYENDYYSGNNGTLKFANSFWFNYESEIKQPFIEKLTNNYYAEAYKTAFDAEGLNNIAAWIKYYTNGMAKINPDSLEVNRETVCLLLNTLYFDGKWEKTFKSSKTYSDDFYRDNPINAQYMIHEVHSSYYEDDIFESVIDRFKNYISITYIRPKNDVDVLNVLRSLTRNNVYPEERIHVEATISVPKFKYDSGFDLNNTLQELGVNKIFELGHLQGIQNDDSLFIEKIKQKSGISFSEEGVKAFSFTWSLGATSAEPGDKIEFKLDRPFIYIINDPLGIPLFIGVLDNPNA